MNLIVIHIFANREAQIVSDTLNYKANIDKFTKLQAVVDDVKSKRPSDIEEKDFHAINIFPNIRVAYITDSKKTSFFCNYKDLDQNKINDLVSEFQSLKDADPS